MKCFKILTDEDFGLEIKEMDNPRTRTAARGIIINSDGKIAVLNKQNKNEYKLVGGGIDDEELPDQAFKREVLEEAGARIKNVWLLGMIEEQKSQDNFKQTSYVYVADVVSIEEPNYTQKEIDEGSRTIWVTVDEAMNLIKNCEDKLIGSKYEDVYHTKFIVRRDYEILKYYKKQTELN